MPKNRYDAVIIGGGAAGLFCAFQAGRRGLRVAVLEHNAEVGRKILISGGGRCNFTNAGTTAENFISKNPHFAKSALAGYTPSDFVELVKKHRIPFYEKKLGQLFCRESSRAIVQMLLEECRAAKVDVITSCRVDSVKRGDRFITTTSLGDIESDKLVIACGGLSFPKIGATGFGYEIARQFGLKIVETRPSLVAMVLEGKSYKELAGVSVEAAVAIGRHAFRENILFTHRGLSGPAILQISNYWEKGRAVHVDLSAAIDPDIKGKKTVGNTFAAAMPARLVDTLVPRPLREKAVDALTPGDRDALVALLSKWQVKFSGTEGYDRAEVTLGGVSTDELSSKTMEAKKVPGLYFIGEVVDVTGWLGGYNFQWAWASGYASAKAL